MKPGLIRVFCWGFSCDQSGLFLVLTGDPEPSSGGRLKCKLMVEKHDEEGNISK